MGPTITQLTTTNDQLTFTMGNVNVSIANAIRRIMLSDIPSVVFRTTPYEENNMTISINTTRMNNELIKQRMSCVPIHISDSEFPIENYVIELDKKNEGDVIDFVTTGDIRIKEISTGTYLSLAETAKIFPPNKITGDYIDLMRLRPRLSKDIDGEQLKLSSTLALGTAKQNGSFNVVSTGSYGYTPDPVQIKIQRDAMEKEFIAAKVDKPTIAFKLKDWELLQAQTINIPDSFDFIVQSVGQFSNVNIVYRAIDIMLAKLSTFKTVIQSDDLLIKVTDTTLANGFDIDLIGEDYTLGKALEYMLYHTHCDLSPGTSDKILSFCGFNKPHPHMDDSVIRLGFRESTDKAKVVEILVGATTALEVIYNKLADYFKTDV